jgi:transposase
MPNYAALDVSLETTAICVVDERGRMIREKKVATCPDAIALILCEGSHELARVGLETGPLAMWLWNELRDRGLPVVCLDARHAHAALKGRGGSGNLNSRDKWIFRV